MDWNAIVENIKIFFQQPVAIIGCSVGCLLFYTLTFLSKTSFGKKSIRKVNNAFNELKQGYEENKAQLGEKVAYLRNEYEEKVAIVEKHALELETLLFEISENINNKKVKELVEQYKLKKDETQIKVNDLIEKSSLAMSEKINEVQTQMEEYKESLKIEYQNMVEQYKKELEELHKRLEEKETELIENEEEQAKE